MKILWHLLFISVPLIACAASPSLKYACRRMQTSTIDSQYMYPESEAAIRGVVCRATLVTHNMTSRLNIIQNILHNAYDDRHWFVINGIFNMARHYNPLLILNIRYKGDEAAYTIFTVKKKI